MTVKQFATKTGLDDVKARVLEMENAVGAQGFIQLQHSDSLTTHTTTLADHGTRLNALESWRVSFFTQLASHTSIISSLNLIAIDHDGRLNDHQGRLEQLEPKEAELRNRVGYIESYLHAQDPEFPAEGGSSGGGGGGSGGSVAWADITGKPISLAGFGLSVEVAEAISQALAALVLPLTVAFSGNGTVTIPVARAVTYTVPITDGTGNLVYEIALATSPAVFVVVNFPTTPLQLAVGDRLRISCTGLIGSKTVTLT